MNKPTIKRRRSRKNHLRYRLQAAEPLESRHLLAATPIGYWNFDDVGNLGGDSSGHGNDLLSFGGASLAASGVTGRALSLDGTGYLGGINPVDLPVGSEPYSIAAWIKPSSVGEIGIVGWGDFGAILKEATLGLYDANGVRHDWGIANVRATSSEVTAAGVDLDDGNWHHVAATFDGTERAVWLDGEKLKGATAPVHFLENKNFRVGSSCVGCNDELFRGLLDDVAVWDVGLDSSQVAALFNGASPLELREAGLISQWVADDLNTTLRDGDTVTAWTENVLGAVATASGMVTLRTNEFNGHSVLRFNPSDGPDQLRVLAAENGFAGVGDFSVAIVFRAASAGVGDNVRWDQNTGLIDSSQLGVTNDWGLALNSKGQVGGGIGAPDVTAYSPTGGNFANGQPHVAVFSRVGGTLSLYVDDFAPVQRSDAGTSLRGVFDLVIGSLQTNENYFIGDIAEIQLYNKALATEEINALTNQLITKYAIVSPEVPIHIAGELLVDLRATDPSAGTASWANRGSLAGDFARIGNPLVEVIQGVTAVSLNSDHPSSGQDDAFTGPIAPAYLTGNSTRSIEVWAYNPNDGTQQALETMVAWGRRGGPEGSNEAFAYGNHGTWGALGQWGGPDMPWFPGGGSPPLGQWHHLVYTFDGSTGRVYADGVLTNSENFTLSTHPGMTINLGAQNDAGGILSLAGGEPGSLSLANVRIHTGILSDADIAANFAAGIQIAGDPPTPSPDAYTVVEDITLSVPANAGVLHNDTDPNMLDLTAILDAAPDHGTLVLGLDGSFTYTPDANYFGADSFAYRANNGDVASDPVTVELDVQPQYDPVLAVADRYVVDVNQTFVVATNTGVLANDPNVDGLPLTAVLVNDQTAGQLTLNPDGSFTYVPRGALGTQTFSYFVEDTVGPSNTATVTLLVDTVPVADNDSYTVNEDGRLTVDAASGVLRNDMDSDADPLLAHLVDDVRHGTLVLNSDGSFEYVPDGNYFGDDSFRYMANDGDQDSNVVTATIHVTAVNDAPVAVDDTYFGFENQQFVRGVVQGLLANDVDVDGPTLSVLLVEPPAEGTLELHSDGSFTYTPPADYLGTQTFTYSASDSLTQSAPARVDLLINSLDQQIVMNEINYDPADNTVRTEFIELFNAGQSLVDLSSWFFSAGIDYTFPTGTVIQPGEYLVVGENPATLSDQFDITALGPWEGTLVNEGEEIVLRNALADVVDRVDYGVAFPWPTAAAGDGSSMELVHPTLDNNLGGSWRSSTGDLPSRPSPGKQNSVFAVNAPPQTRQADHSPKQPTSADETVITLKATDPDGVASVELQYQLVLPGQYIPAFIPLTKAQLLQNADAPPARNPAYDDPANWVTIPMKDDGAGSDARAGDGTFTATIPAQDHRTLVRYRMIVADALGASVQVPYFDDAALNFAYFVYDGIPEYQTNQGTFNTGVLESLPVYHFLTRGEDMEEVLAYNTADQIDQGPDARFTYNWPGTMVYNGIVYDNIKYRLRGANGRYYGRGKRSMRFRFNKGSYFQAHDNDGNPYPEKWRTLTTGKGFDNRLTLTQGLNEALSLHLFDTIGLPTQDTHWVHFRVIDGAAEAPDQWRGDFWGLNFILETYDVHFLEAHNLEKGNLYKLINSRSDAASQQRYQAPNAVKNGSDHDNIETNLTGSSSAEWLDAHVDLEKYYLFHSLAEAIRHYDFWPSANKNMVYYFAPEYTAANNFLGKLWILPWDTDASWGPTWNSGHDVVYNGLFPTSGGGSDSNSTPELWPAYFNVVREIRDLLWQPDQIEPLIDEFAAIIEDFELADRARWQNAPADAGNYNGIGGAGATSLAALVQDMKNFAFVGGSWPGGSVGPGGRAAFLDTLQGSQGEGAQLPSTPFISYVGDPDFSTSGLAFQTSDFADPQGADTFAAMEWRVAKITDPSAPAYDPNEKFRLEWDADWESGELTTFANSLEIPSGVTDVGYTYRARVRVQDTTGRWSHWSEPLEFTTTAPDNNQLLKDHLRVAEVHFNPLGPTNAEIIAGFDDNDDFEFIDLINTSATETLDLSGAKFVNGINFDFTGGSVTTLAPGERLVIVEDRDAFALRYGTEVNVAGEWSGGLNNSGERLELVAPDGTPISDFTFAANDDWPSRADGDGSSLVVVDPNGDYADPMNWRASTTIHGTPGQPESTFTGGIVINEILANSESPAIDAVELYNPTASSIDASGWFLSDGNGNTDSLTRYQIPAGTVINAGGYLVLDETDFNAGGGTHPNDFAFGSNGDEVWLTAGTPFRPTFFVDDVAFGGSHTSETIGRVPSGDGLFAPLYRSSLGCENGTPRVGPLVITELMYAPGEPTAAERALAPDLQAEDLEFVEIYNPAAESVDLTGWKLVGGVEFDFFAATTLAANASRVVMRFNPNLPANGDKVRAFELRYGLTVDDSFTGGYAGRLSDVGERVELRRLIADPLGDLLVTEDAVVYDTVPPWPDPVTLAGNGISRISAAYWGSAADSWMLAAASPGVVSFTANLPGDLTGDGQITVDDLNVLTVVVARNTTIMAYDINRDGSVNSSDVDALLASMGSLTGDADLSGTVNAADLNQVGLHWQQTNCVTWHEGDFNGDGQVTAADLNRLGLHWLQAAAPLAAARPPRAALPALAAPAAAWPTATQVAAPTVDPLMDQVESAVANGSGRHSSVVQPFLRRLQWHRNVSTRGTATTDQRVVADMKPDESSLIDDLFASW